MTSWTDEQLLTVRQVALLLGEDPYQFPKTYGSYPGLPAPFREDPVWTPEQIQPLIAANKDKTPNRRTREVKLTDRDLLDTKQCAALYNPTPIAETTFNSYVRRAAKRAAEGLETLSPAPQPVRHTRGHPLWDPNELRDHLATRPGPGYFVAGETRRGYRGGKVPTGAVRG